MSEEKNPQIKAVLWLDDQVVEVKVPDNVSVKWGGPQGPVVGHVTQSAMTDEGFGFTVTLDTDEGRELWAKANPPMKAHYSIEENSAVYAQEALLADSIAKLNRHNVITGEWYGPDPEPQAMGRECPCPSIQCANWTKNLLKPTKIFSSQRVGKTHSQQQEEKHE